MVNCRGVPSGPELDVTAGLGVPCYEAQADGVPCEELRDCAECERARDASAGAAVDPIRGTGSVSSEPDLFSSRRSGF